MAQEMVSFGDILSAVRETLGVQSSDTLATNKIKRIINEVYLDEIGPYKPWFWLKKNIQVIHEAAIEEGTVAVDQSNAVVSLTDDPNISVIGYRFAVSGSSQVYTVIDQDDEDLTLNIAFQEDSDAAASYKLWRDRFDLPVEAKETIEIWHNQWQKPLEAVGPQAFRSLEAANPTLEGFPLQYSTSDFFVPVDEDAEVEDTRYRQTQIYPSINDENVVLNVDYVQEVVALDDLLDEPLMPIGDRVSLFYGAASRAYSTIARNETEAASYYQRFQTKLQRMAANRDEGQDTPKLRPNPRYFNSIRRSGLKRGGW